MHFYPRIPRSASIDTYTDVNDAMTETFLRSTFFHPFPKDYACSDAERDLPSIKDPKVKPE